MGYVKIERNLTTPRSRRCVCVVTQWGFYGIFISVGYSYCFHPAKQKHVFVQLPFAVNKRFRKVDPERLSMSLERFSFFKLGVFFNRKPTHPIQPSLWPWPGGAGEVVRTGVFGFIAVAFRGIQIIPDWSRLKEIYRSRPSAAAVAAKDP